MNEIRPKRILIFSLVYFPRFVGGAEVAIKEITDRISREDIEFDMVTLRMDSRLPRFEKIGNVNIYRIGWTSTKKNSKKNSKNISPDSLSLYLHLNKYAFLLTGLIKASSLHRKRKYSAIWSIMATYNSFTALFFKLLHRRVPFIFTLQDGDPIAHIKRRARPLYPLFKMIFTSADHVQTISKYLADWAREMGSRCPITIVPNAVDFELFSKRATENELQSLKNKLNKKVGDIFLITTSRLVVKNAVGDIIDSLGYLPKNIKLLILGEGYQDGILKGRVERMGLTDRVHFLGFVSHAEMPKYLHISDIFIRPSLSEGFGVSFIEAMAAHVPVIAPPVGGIIDFLRDNETGLFCEVKNPKSIAEQVERLTNDKGLRDRIVKNAEIMVREKYQWKEIAGQMKKVFEDTII